MKSREELLDEVLFKIVSNYETSYCLNGEPIVLLRVSPSTIKEAKDLLRKQTDE